MIFEGDRSLAPIDQHLTWKTIPLQQPKIVVEDIGEHFWCPGQRLHYLPTSVTKVRRIDTPDKVNQADT